ncbi:MAG: hypothetical protein PHP54_03345 [Clostridia bacterium]|nr:hypothetical protein [Clostridia bacterium]
MSNDFLEGLQNGVNSSEEIEKEKDLMELSNINNIKVPEEYQAVKNSIGGVLNFRNENKELPPNMSELMTIAINLNNAIVKNGTQPELVDAYNVLHEHLGDSLKSHYPQATNLSQLLNTFKENMGIQRIKGDAGNYLRTLSGVSLFQIQQAKEGNIVHPNSFEQSIINDSDLEDLPEYIREDSTNLKEDIDHPEKFLQMEEQVK